MLDDSVPDHSVSYHSVRDHSVRDHAHCDEASMIPTCVAPVWMPVSVVILAAVTATPRQMPWAIKNMD